MLIKTRHPYHRLQRDQNNRDQNNKSAGTVGAIRPGVKPVPTKVASMSSQHWDEKSFCENYSSTWEISYDEVHYGWLAPGESQLRLIDLDLANANVLDIGCGMGENLIALARQGANCHGIDISGYMLSRARQNMARFEDEINAIHFKQQDMRQTDFFPGTAFDLILSAYSMEYLNSTQELKDLFYNLFKRLKPGGALIFCFSHQLQHFRHNRLANASSKTGEDAFSTLIYSFRDVVSALSEVGYVIERIVEQGTRNPSKLSYEDARCFPYHFHRNQNPCHPQFDHESNKTPHTIIYKARKLDTHGLQQDHQLTFNYATQQIRIWGQNRSITRSTPFTVGTTEFTAHQLAPKDAVVGLCEVLAIQVREDDIQPTQDLTLTVDLDGSKAELMVNVNSVQALVHRRLQATGLHPSYQRSVFPGSEEIQSGLFIKRIDPIYGEIDRLFPRQRPGILVFINGEEPAHGTIGLEDISATPGDHIQVMYITTSWGKDWRKRRRASEQMDLF